MPNYTAFTNFTIEKCDLQKTTFPPRGGVHSLSSAIPAMMIREGPYHFCTSIKGALKIWGIAPLRLNLYNFGIHRANPAKFKNKSATKLHTVPGNFQKNGM